jgi:NADPH2:quinone reductase
MRAALCKQFGGPEVITVETIEDPKPADGEAVIKVNAVALNFLDTLMIRGKYQHKIEPPFSPGVEVAGTIAGLGSGVTGFNVGDRVLAFVGMNGCREQVATNASELIPLPDTVDDKVASCLSVTYGTAVHALRDRAKLQAGETVAVLGASGGAGLAAVEIAKLMDGRVIAAASSAEKLEVCRAHGADEVINYRDENLKDRLKALTGGKGADVIYDCVGGPYSEPALRAAAWEGRFLVVGFAAGEIPKIPLNLLLLKGCAMVGVFWGEFATRDPAGNRRNIEQVIEWCASGRLEPHIDATFSLDQTREALEAIDQRQATGKVVVLPQMG